VATRQTSRARRRQARQRAAERAARWQDVWERAPSLLYNPYEPPADQVLGVLNHVMAQICREMLGLGTRVTGTGHPPALRNATLVVDGSGRWRLGLHFEFDVNYYRNVPELTRPDAERWLRQLQREPRRLLAAAEGVYSTILEDDAFRRRLVESRMARDTLAGMGRDPAALAQMDAQIAALYEHYRNFHQSQTMGAMGWAIDPVSGFDRTLTATEARSDTTLRTQDLIEAARILAGLAPEGRRSYRDDFLQRFTEAAGWVDSTATPNEAQAKGLALLNAHLTPEQQQMLRDKRYFEVTGGESGKRYRINYGRQMNIHELNDKGEAVMGWCFVPQGFLVEGDCMLAQKTALELCEGKALKVANRFSPRAGFVVFDNIPREAQERDLTQRYIIPLQRHGFVRFDSTT